MLPRLLFGRSRQSLSGPEAVQLATGVATLMGTGEDVFAAGRSALGLDVLRFEGDDEATGQGASVSVGRYAAENVYVGARQSLDGQSTSVVVEVELPRNLVVDTEVGQDASSSVGITWRRDF